MKTYRYKVVKTVKAMTESQLGEFGRRGYEMTGVTADEFGYVYYFKKEE